MKVLVLDAEAFSAFAQPAERRFEVVRAAVEAARRIGHQVTTPAVVLAELYRGPGHNQVVDSCLKRESGIDVVNTDRSLARQVGGVLAASVAGSEDMADAHVVAVAVAAGGGVVVTGDPKDLTRLSGPFRQVSIRAI